MTILVPTDFSENANQAIEYAVEIAGATGSMLILLHVLNDKHASLTEKIQVEEKLDLVRKTITEEYALLTCEAKTLTGEVVAEILREADRSKADMIVMGTKGATNLGRLFFGSNTASIIENASCIVLSVPGNSAFRKPEKMLFSTNFTREDLHAAVQFVSLAKAFQATVIIAHVSLEHQREEVETSMVQIFANEVSELTNYKKISTRVSSDNTISMGLDTLIAETGADIIALSTRKRGLFEKVYNPSLTKKYSLQADIPLIAFHTQALGDQA